MYSKGMSGLSSGMSGISSGFSGIAALSKSAAGSFASGLVGKIEKNSLPKIYSLDKKLYLNYADQTIENKPLGLDFKRAQNVAIVPILWQEPEDISLIFAGAHLVILVVILVLVGLNLTKGDHSFQISVNTILFLYFLVFVCIMDSPVFIKMFIFLLLMHVIKSPVFTPTMDKNNKYLYFAQAFMLLLTTFIYTNFQFVLRLSFLAPNLKAWYFPSVSSSSIAGALYDTLVEMCNESVIIFFLLYITGLFCFATKL